MSKTLLGIDLGTSSVKVGVFDVETLNVLALGSAEYPIQHPQPNTAEQDPDAWWAATVEAVRTALASVRADDVVGIGLSGQMHGLVCIGKNHAPVCPAIIWADNRSKAEVADLFRLQHDIDDVLPGLPAIGFAASSALWLKTHQPSILAQTHQWCLPKDYIRLKLTDVLATEPSDAASTWLYDIAKHDWSETLMAHCGLRRDQMPTVVPSAAVSGTLTATAARELGLPEGIPVAGGSADLPAQALGQGISSPESLLLTVGSGGQIFVPSAERPQNTDNAFYVFNNNIAGTWYIQNAILAAGLSLRWLRDLLKVDGYAQLSEQAAQVPAGADGLVFLPHLAGVRDPNEDNKIAGGLYGLRLNHTSSHLARAVMEGVAFAMKDSLSQVPHASGHIVLSGGIIESPMWCQILADVLDMTLHAPTASSPYGCIGAAILAGVSTGDYADVQDGTRRLQHAYTTYHPQAADLYAEPYRMYQKLWQFALDA